MTDQIDASSNLQFHDGVWLGVIPSAHGPLELVLDGTDSAPDGQHVAAIQRFMPTAHDTIERLRRRLPLAFLWRPVRLAVNQQNRVGVQFQRRIVTAMRLLFADEA